MTIQKRWTDWNSLAGQEKHCSRTTYHERLLQSTYCHLLRRISQRYRGRYHVYGVHGLGKFRPHFEGIWSSKSRYVLSRGCCMRSAKAIQTLNDLLLTVCRRAWQNHSCHPERLDLSLRSPPNNAQRHQAFQRLPELERRYQAM